MQIRMYAEIALLDLIFTRVATEQVISAIQHSHWISSRSPQSLVICTCFVNIILKTKLKTSAENITVFRLYYNSYSILVKIIKRDFRCEYGCMLKSHFWILYLPELQTNK